MSASDISSGALFSCHCLPLQVKSSYAEDSRNVREHLLPLPFQNAGPCWKQANRAAGIESWKPTPWTWFLESSPHLPMPLNSQPTRETGFLESTSEASRWKVQGRANYHVNFVLKFCIFICILSRAIMASDWGSVQKTLTVPLPVSMYLAMTSIHTGQWISASCWVWSNWVYITHVELLAKQSVNAEMSPVTWCELLTWRLPPVFHHLKKQ